jgi:hypothetical protein
MRSLLNLTNPSGRHAREGGHPVNADAPVLHNDRPEYWIVRLRGR